MWALPNYDIQPLYPLQSFPLCLVPRCLQCQPSETLQLEPLYYDENRYQDTPEVRKQRTDFTTRIGLLGCEK